MPSSSQVTGQMTPAPVTPAPSSAPATKNVADIPGHADLIKRQQELERKEAELERRERQMNVRFVSFTKLGFYLCFSTSFS